MLPSTVTKIYVPKSANLARPQGLKPQEPNPMMAAHHPPPETSNSLHVSFPSHSLPNNLQFKSSPSASEDSLNYVVLSSLRNPTVSSAKLSVLYSTSETNTLVAQPHQSPSKLVGRPLVGQTNMNTSVPIPSISAAAQGKSTGSKLQVFRLVTSVAGNLSSLKLGQPRTMMPIQQIAPLGVVGNVTQVSNAHPQKINLPIHQVIPKSVSNQTTLSQRVLLPATKAHIPIRPLSTSQIRPSLLTTSNITPQANMASVQSYTLLPAHLVHTSSDKAAISNNTNHTAQPQIRIASAPSAAPAPCSEFVAIATADSGAVSDVSSLNSFNGNTIEAAGARPRKPCNCTKSQCLKLYCDCFANGEFCHNCNCNNCANNLNHEEERSRAIKSCLDRNPQAFHPKIGKGRTGEGDRRHNKGCNCKRSGCLKNYCECYEAKIMCSNTCKCVGCKNFEDSPDRKSLMHLADAAEVRVLQQSSLTNKFPNIPEIPSKLSTDQGRERLPYSFVTTEVVEATCACLLAQAEEAERKNLSLERQERMVLEEFGRCLSKIIDCSNGARECVSSP